VGQLSFSDVGGVLVDNIFFLFLGQWLSTGSKFAEVGKFVSFSKMTYIFDLKVVPRSQFFPV
jgi:hypothetical protein